MLTLYNMQLSTGSLKQARCQREECATTRRVCDVIDTSNLDLSTGGGSGALDDDDNSLDDEIVVDGDAVMFSVRPYLVSLRLAGLYFASFCNMSNIKGQNELPQTSVIRGIHQWRKSDFIGRSYATVVLVLLWINVGRILTIFNGNESFNKTLILKLTVASSMLLSAILQTSLYKASATGRLDQIFRQLRTTAYRLRKIRLEATRKTLWMWLFFIVYYTFFVIYLFSGDEMLDIFLAPFVTWIPASDISLTAMRSVFSIIFIYIMTSWCLPISTAQMISGTLRYEFQFLNQQFRRAIDDFRHATISTVTW